MTRAVSTRSRGGGPARHAVGIVLGRRALAPPPEALDTDGPDTIMPVLLPAWWAVLGQIGGGAAMLWWVAAGFDGLIAARVVCMVLALAVMARGCTGGLARGAGWVDGGRVGRGCIGGSIGR